VTAHSVPKSLRLVTRALPKQYPGTPVSWRPAGRDGYPPPPRTCQGRGRLTPARAARQVVVFDQASKLAHCVAWVHMDQHASVEAAYRAGRPARLAHWSPECAAPAAAQRPGAPRAPAEVLRLKSWPSGGLACGSAAARPQPGGGAMPAVHAGRGDDASRLQQCPYRWTCVLDCNQAHACSACSVTWQFRRVPWSALAGRRRAVRPRSRAGAAVAELAAAAAGRQRHQPRELPGECGGGEGAHPGGRRVPAGAQPALPPAHVRRPVRDLPVRPCSSPPGPAHL